MQMEVLQQHFLWYICFVMVKILNKLFSVDFDFGCVMETKRFKVRKDFIPC